MSSVNNQNYTGKKLKIVTYPNEILLKPNEEVKFPLQPEIKELIQDMWQTVKKIGVGLAAPQVGKNYKLCIIHLRDEKSKKAQDIVLINPKISFYSEAKAKMVEGCLSFPDEFIEIIRPYGIVLEWQDEKGRNKKKAFSGLAARVIQHEVDHLNGKLFINMGGRKVNLNEEEVDVIE